MTFDCPKCGELIDIGDQRGDGNVDCPACGTNIRYSSKKIYSGKVLAGFELQDLLGVGGMGEVWLAYQQSMDRRVAVKILSPYLARDKSFVDNFLKEVKLAAKLDHPNIVSAFDAGVENDIYYLAMSYVPGETFAARIAREKQLPESEILTVAFHVAKALQYAWDRFHIIHRDVNPSNIMLTPDGDIKLMDMGISKNVAEGEAGQDEDLEGTPNYISPEQIRGKDRVDVRSDMYSLGATLYHLATGKIPFDSKDPYDVLKRQLEEDPQPVRELNPGVSHPLSILIETMMAKDREKRPVSWSDLLADVQRVIGGQYPKTPHPDHGIFETQPITAIGDVERKQVKISADHLREVHDSQIKNLAHGKRRSLLPPLVVLLALVALAAFLALHLVDEKGPQQVALEENIPQPKPPTEVVQPPEKSDKSESDPEEEREKRLRELDSEWESTLEFVRNNPNDFSEIIAKFREFSRIAEGTKYARMAEKGVSQTVKRRNKAVGEVMQSLGNLATPYLNSEDYRAAAKLFEEYNGPLAQQTSEQRARMAQRYKSRAEKENDKFEKEKLAREKQLESFIQRIAADICEGNLSEVIRESQEFKQRPLTDAVKETIERIREEIMAIGNVDQYVADALREQEGRTITLTIRGEQTPIRIKSVSGNHIAAEIKKGRGYAHVTFSTRQIPFEERFELIENKMDTVPRALYGGIYYYKNNLFEKSIQLFEDTGVLADSLTTYVERRKEEVSKSRVVREFAHIMGRIGVSINPDAVEWTTIDQAVTRNRISPERGRILKDKIDAFKSQYNDSEFVQANTKPIDALLSQLDDIATGESGRDVVGTASRPNAIEEHRFYEPIRKARLTSGRRLLCNPLGKNGGIIPELLKEELTPKMTLVLQPGDYNNRPIVINRLKGIIIETQEGVENCDIKLIDCDNATVRSAEAVSISARGSSFLMIDSELSELSVRDSSALIHNCRIRNVVTRSELILDHTLIGSIAAVGTDEVLIRNSIICGDNFNIEQARHDSMPCFRFHLEYPAEIELQNCIVFTSGIVGGAYANSWRLESGRYPPSQLEEERIFMRLDSMNEYIDAHNTQFADPEFVNLKDENFDLEPGSPAKKAAMSGKDLGPDPELDPLPF